MTEAQIIYTLHVYDREATFDWNGSLALMDWRGESPKPTQKQLDALWPTVEAEYWQATNAPVEQARHAAYITDADPLFFKWQRGTGTEQEWLDAVQAVKDAHPYPDPV